jgi:hypothetical protein
MTVSQLERRVVVDPSEIEIVVSAFKAAYTWLEIRDADSTNKERLAKAFIEIVRTGERDVYKITNRAIELYLR